MAEDTKKEGNNQQGEQDYSQMSVEELDNLLREGHGIVTNEQPEPEPPQEAPEEAKAEGEPEAAPPTDAAEGKAEEKTEEPGQPEKPEPEFDFQKSLADENELLARRLEVAERKRDAIAGTKGAEIDQLRRTIAALQQQLQQGATGPREDDFEAPSRPAFQPEGPATVPSPVEERLMRLEQGERQRAIHDAYARFQAENPNIDEATSGRLADHVKRKMQEVGAQNLDAVQAGAYAKWVLDASLVDARLELLREQRKQALERKASQVSERRVLKQESAPSASGATPAPKPKQKRIEDMTAEEADKELIRLYGDGHYRRPTRQ